MIGRTNHIFAFLPFYRNRDNQQRMKNGCEFCNRLAKVPNTQIPTFAVLATVSPAPSVSFTIRKEDGTLQQTMGLDLLTLSQQVGGQNWIRYKGGATVSLPCGVYEVRLTVDGITYFSEQWEAIEVPATENWWRLDASSSVDVSGFLYRPNFVQSLWVEGFHETPQIVDDTAVELDGENEEYLISHDVKERHTLKVPDMPDYLIHALQGLRDVAEVGTVTLANMLTGEVHTLIAPSVSFDPQQDDCANLMTLNFQTAHTLFQGCAANIITSTLDAAIA